MALLLMVPLSPWIEKEDSGFKSTRQGMFFRDRVPLKARLGRVLGPTLLECAMSDLLIVIIVVALVFFTAWFSKLSAQLNEGLNGLGATDDDIQEIKEGIEIVAAVLNKLPDLMPQFNMNTNPLQPIFEAFAKKLSGETPLMTYEGTRDADGRFSHGTTQEQTQDTTQSETDD